MNDDPKALTGAEISLLAWFAEDPQGRLMVSGVNDGYDFRAGVPGDKTSPLASIRDAELIALKRSMGGRVPEIGRLLRLGFLGNASPEKWSSRVALGNWRNIGRGMTRKGYEFWETTARAIHEEKVARKQKNEEAVSRLILIRAPVTIVPRLPHGYSMPAEIVVVATHVARVIKETEGRLYVEDIKQVPHPGNLDWAAHPIKGRAPSIYVEKKSVMAEHISAALVESINSLDKEYVTEIREAQQRYADAVEEQARQLSERLLQKRAEREDTMMEALKGATASPKP